VSRQPESSTTALVPGEKGPALFPPATPRARLPDEAPKGGPISTPAKAKNLRARRRLRTFTSRPGPGPEDLAILFAEVAGQNRLPPLSPVSDKSEPTPSSARGPVWSDPASPSPQTRTSKERQVVPPYLQNHHGEDFPRVKHSPAKGRHSTGGV